MTGLQERENSPQAQASRLFRELMYPPDHPYRNTLNGTLETVPTITQADIVDFYQTHYYPDNAVVVVVGDVQAEAVKDLLEKYFQSWLLERPNPVTPFPEVGHAPLAAKAVFTMPGKSQSDLIIGFMGPARHSPDFYAAHLGNIVLGQLGLGGRLGESVRETHGLAYYVRANLGSGYTPAPWSVSAGVNKTNMEKAVGLILSELERFSETAVSEEELADAKAYVTGILPLQLERNEGIASTLLYMERHQLGDDYIMRYPEQIGSITADEVLTASQRYIRPTDAVIAIAGDYEATSDEPAK
jgi:zinc protease